MLKCDRCEAELSRCIKEYCPDCRQKLDEEDADPKLKSLKDAHERAKRAEEEALAAMDISRKEYDEAVDYRRRRQIALADYKRDIERRTNAAVAADFLEREAKKLREHPETFDEAEFCQKRPMEYVNQNYPFFKDNTPVITTFKMKTWPQRKVAKEGEEG